MIYYLIALEKSRDKLTFLMLFYVDESILEDRKEINKMEAASAWHAWSAIRI